MAEQSRTEEILRATIDGDEYTKTPQSREEELLLELKQTIEAGGGASVVPNPEGEATETLEKLGINDTVYGIPSGGDSAVEIFYITTNGNNKRIAINGGKTIQDILDCISGGKVPVLLDQNKTCYYYMDYTSGLLSSNTPYFQSTGILYSQQKSSYYMRASYISGVKEGVVMDHFTLLITDFKLTTL